MGNDATRGCLATPTTSVKVVDEATDFVAYGGRPGRCRVRIYRNPDGSAIVAYSALSGPPLAYACEELIAQLLQRYFPTPTTEVTAITWLEHHPSASRPLVQAQVAAREVRFGSVRWPVGGWLSPTAPVVRQ